MSIPQEKRRSCSDSALKCFGTAYIFEKKALRLKRLTIVLSFLYIAVPITVYTIISTFNKPDIIDIVLPIAGIIAGIQLLLTVWAMAAGWNRNLSYYLDSKASNYRLANSFAGLAKTEVLSDHEFGIQFEVLEKENQLRSDMDMKYNVSEKEKRMGMRAGLREYQRKCATCSTAPTTMKASDCDTCGNY